MTVVAKMGHLIMCFDAKWKIREEGNPLLDCDVARYRFVCATSYFVVRIPMVRLSLDVDRVLFESLCQKRTPVHMPVTSLHRVPAFAACTGAAERRRVAIVKRNLNFPSRVIVIYEVHAVPDHLHNRAAPLGFKADFQSPVVKIKARAFPVGSSRSRSSRQHVGGIFHALKNAACR